MKGKKRIGSIIQENFPELRQSTYWVPSIMDEKRLTPVEIIGYPNSQLCCSVSIIFREMQIEMRSHFHLLDWLKNKVWQCQVLERIWVQMVLLHTASGNVKQSFGQSIWQMVSRAEDMQIRQLRNSTSGYYH